MTQASALVAALRAQGAAVAVAESLTGGLVTATLTAVPGASAVVRGGVVAYAADVKVGVLAVPERTLERFGAVSAECAVDMAVGVARLLGATYAVATTGVAGPEAVAGHPVGEVFVAVSGPGRTRVEPLRLTGSREAIRSATVAVAVDLLTREVLGGGREQPD